MGVARDRIKQCRISCRMTQDEVAGYLGTTKQTVYKYETGVITNIPLIAIEKMARLFHVTPEYLTGWKDSFPQPVCLNSDEVRLIGIYRALPEEGKEFMLRQARAAQIMYESEGGELKIAEPSPEK